MTVSLGSIILVDDTDDLTRIADSGNLFCAFIEKEAYPSSC